MGHVRWPPPERSGQRGVTERDMMTRNRDTTRGGVHAPRTSGQRLDAARLNSGYLMTPIRGAQTFRA